MATPRKRWFKVAESLLDEPWTREQKMTLILLMGEMNRRWARNGLSAEDACRIVLSEAAVQEITGLKRIRSGYGALAELSRSVSLEVSLENGFVSVHWPKFAEFQELGARSPGSERAVSGLKMPSPTPSPSPSPKKEKKEESPAAAGAPPSAGAPLFDEPPVKAKRPATERVEPPEAIEFADQFAAAVLGVHPSARPPSPSARREWIREARLMIERDQRPLAELQAVADWLFNSEQSDAQFWRRNVLSVPKFREKYVKLDAARRSERVQPIRKPGPLEQAARNILARAAAR